VRWAAPDPAALAERLERLGSRVDHEAGGGCQSVALGFDRIELAPAAAGRGTGSAQLRPDDRDGYLAAFAVEEPSGDLRRLPGEAVPHPNGTLALAAVGWATVDRARLARTAFPARAFVTTRDEPALGALVVAATLDADRPVPLRLLLLEPSREAFTAAALVRLGEGPVALYLAAADLGATERLLRGRGVPSSGSPRHRSGALVCWCAVSVPGRRRSSSSAPERSRARATIAAAFPVNGEGGSPVSGAGAPVIEVHGLRKRYGEVVAVDGIDFSPSTNRCAR